MTINLITLTDPTSAAAEAYRRLRVNLIATEKKQPLRRLLVAAAGPDDDKATTLANLAVTFAKVGRRVIVVDCDLRHPAQHSIFGLSNTSGVTTALTRVGSALPLQTTELDNLRVLTSGPGVEVPSDLIASPSMSDLIDRLAADADLVLIDVPPVVLATDAVELAVRVDGVLLTIAAGKTRREDAQRAKEMLTRVGANLIGATLVNASVDTEAKKYLTAS